jgi:prepilin-type N-terminal cleavage/methylation domain-containing protein
MTGRGKGVTLIELIITAVIITILAAMCIRGYRSFTAKAVVQEGVAGLMAVKIALMDYYYSHNRQFPDGWEGSEQIRLSEESVRNTLNIRAGELNGQFFNEGCYKVQIYDAAHPGGYNIWCYLDRAPVETRKILVDPGVDAEEAQIVLYGNGSIYANNMSKSGIPPEPPD